MSLTDVPDGLGDRHFNDIRDFLSQILGELTTALAARPNTGMIRVTSRLNSSETNKAIPVWAGTVEDDSVLKARRFDAGGMRYGQSNRSKVYEETVNDRNWDIHYRDWSTQLSEKTDNGYGPGQAYGPIKGFMHQMFIAIRVKQDGKFRHVGTITAGFKHLPDRKTVEPIMKRWAEAGSYVDYLKSNFNLGGPVF